MGCVYFEANVNRVCGCFYRSGVAVIATTIRLLGLGLRL